MFCQAIARAERAHHIREQQSCSGWQLCIALTPAGRQDITKLEMLCLQDATPAAETEAEGEELAADEDAEAGQGLDLSMAKKKKKKKPKARTDEEFGAMVEDVESAPAEGMSLLLS